MDLPLSTARAFFDSKAWTDWTKNKENEYKVQTAIVNRLNSVIQALGIVAKVVAKKRF